MRYKNRPTAFICLLLVIFSNSLRGSDDLLMLVPLIIANQSDQTNENDPIPSGCQFTNPNEPTDDPNPLIDSSGNGRVIVSSNQIPAGYPTPLTTGLCGANIALSELTASPSLKVEEDGTVIDRLDITGTLTIEANNVTVKNSRITGTGLYVINVRSGYSNIVIEDTRIRGVGVETSAAIQGASPYTLRRVHITGGSDNIKASAGILVEDSYVSGLVKHPGSHNDVVQIRSGSNYLFRDSSFIGPWQQSTSVFIIQAKSANIDNLTVENNYISGGGYSIYSNERNGYKMTNVFVTNNRFELNSWQYGWKNANAGIYSGNQQLASP